MPSTPLPLFERAHSFSDRVALIDETGSYSFEALLEAADSIASALIQTGFEPEEPIPFLIPSSFEYVAVQWGIWRAGGVAVPLSPLYPAAELHALLVDLGASTFVGSESCSGLCRDLESQSKGRVLSAKALMGQSSLRRFPKVSLDDPAMILFTSGTTGRPKGVVISHQNLHFQIQTLVEAWEWVQDDSILNVLPLHHTHGIVNILLCALYSGARCELWPRFRADAVWNRFLGRDLTLFMAVPTIYQKLLEYWESCEVDRRRELSNSLESFRLMVSGSAALSPQLFEEWAALSGQFLLERYGMTEIGMALANPFHGSRQAGTVGMALPGVAVQLVDESGQVIEGDGIAGEIQVLSAGVFKSYWQRPVETAQSFAGDWFRTGDLAIRESGYYRILGRRSVDIIKTGGYKVSALEIEQKLQEHPAVRDCAVVGSPDREWGEQVCAALTFKPGNRTDSDQVRDWAKSQLAPYKVPRRILVLEELPRNALGKVVKNRIKDHFESSDQSGVTS